MAKTEALRWPMLRPALIGSACLALAGCASMARVREFRGGGEAKVLSDGQTYSLTLNPRQNSILLTRDEDTRQASIVALGIPPTHLATPRPWRKAAETFLAPVGCAVGELEGVQQHVAWAAFYTCPVSIDLRALVTAQHKALMEGEPLEVTAPR